VSEVGSGKQRHQLTRRKRGSIARARPITPTWICGSPLSAAFFGREALDIYDWPGEIRKLPLRTKRNARWRHCTSPPNRPSSSIKWRGPFAMNTPSASFILTCSCAAGGRAGDVLSLLSERHPIPRSFSQLPTSPASIQGRHNEDGRRWVIKGLTQLRRRLLACSNVGVIVIFSEAAKPTRHRADCD